MNPHILNQINGLMANRIRSLKNCKFRTYNYFILSGRTQQVLPENPDRVALIIFANTIHAMVNLLPGSLTPSLGTPITFSTSFALPLDPANTQGFYEFLHVPTNAITMCTDNFGITPVQGIILEGVRA